MSSRPSVSVCMATYNGERYVAEQLMSILDQLEPGDEVVVVDDASADETVGVVAGIADARVRVIRNPENLGYVGAFERALTLATGDVMLLSDQDDLWIEGRVGALLTATQSHSVVASNLLLLGTGEPLASPVTGRPWLLRAQGESKRFRNEIKMLIGDAPYFGCAMALRRDALDLVLPFPRYLHESHDLWIATAANTARILGHLEQPTLLRRLHDSNASSPRPRGILPALRSRVLLLRLWATALGRARRSSGVG